MKLHFPKIKFVLQTWTHIECNKDESWRHITENETFVTHSTITDYFDDKNITKLCTILPESSIELVGITDGYIGKGPCPKKDGRICGMECTKV